MINTVNYDMYSGAENNKRRQKGMAGKCSIQIHSFFSQQHKVYCTKLKPSSPYTSFFLIIWIEMVQANQKNQVSEMWKIPTEACASIFGHQIVSQSTFQIALFHFRPFTNLFWHKKQSHFVVKRRQLLKGLKMGRELTARSLGFGLLPVFVAVYSEAEGVAVRVDRSGDKREHTGDRRAEGGDRRGERAKGENLSALTSPAGSPLCPPLTPNPWPPGVWPVGVLKQVFMPESDATSFFRRRSRRSAYYNAEDQGKHKLLLDEEKDCLVSVMQHLFIYAINQNETKLRIHDFLE